MSGPCPSRKCVNGESKRLVVKRIAIAADVLIVACHTCRLYVLGIAWAPNNGVQVFSVISGLFYGIRLYVVEVGY